MPILISENESLQILDVSTPTPQVWYRDRAYDWHFLAPNFGAYFRMMLVHLGLPQWQLLFTPAGPTPRAKVSLAISLPRLQLRSLYLGNIFAFFYFNNKQLRFVQTF